MALNILDFTFKASQKKQPLPLEWSHTGIVGSGDMEVLIRQKDLKGSVAFKVTTPVTGFDDVWQKVLEKFVEDTGLYDASIEINDNNATPFIVAMRLKQALLEAKDGGENA